MAEFDISWRRIGDDHPPLVIAEIGINHGGSLDLAIDMADSAINSGAEVIKHQTHVIEDEMSIEARHIYPANSNETIFEIIKKSSLSEKDEYKLMDYILKKKRIFISTPFSRKAADRLAKFNVPAFKIGSGECNNYPLIKYISKFRKPIILSTGMNSVETITPAVKILRDEKIPFALLHCTNIYPTPPELVRLGAITVLKNNFPDAVVGLSDHTNSHFTCLGAVALGASILEKHFTDDSNRLGPDISSSMNPRTLMDLIIGSKTIFSARGTNKDPLKEESQTIAFAFASVVATKNIKKGEYFTEENIWVMRPGTGDFPAKEFEKIIGKIAANDIRSGFQIKFNDIK